jgi:hypothetical protein
MIVDWKEYVSNKNKSLVWTSVTAQYWPYFNYYIFGQDYRYIYVGVQNVVKNNVVQINCMVNNWSYRLHISKFGENDLQMYGLQIKNLINLLFKIQSNPPMQSPVLKGHSCRVLSENFIWIEVLKDHFVFVPKVIS